MRTWAELDTQRLSCPQDGIANGDTGGLFINLDGSLVGLDTNNLCNTF